jgi:hypothetical protein
MSQIIVDTYYDKFASLGGNRYGFWSSLTEICIEPAPALSGIFGIRYILPFGQYVEMEDVMLLLLLPSLKRLSISFMASFSATRFEQVKEITDSAISNIEELEVRMAFVSAARLGTFFKPMKNLRRLVWGHRDRQGERVTSGNFTLEGFNALSESKSTLNGLSLFLPDNYPIRSVIEQSLSNLQTFTALKDLRLDASLLFPGHPRTSGPHRVTQALKDILPSSLEVLTIWRAWRGYREFEWESLFRGFPYACRRGRFPRMQRIRLLGDVSPPSFPSDSLWPAIGSVVERVQNAGITIEALKDSGPEFVRACSFEVDVTSH